MATPKKCIATFMINIILILGDAVIFFTITCNNNTFLGQYDCTEIAQILF